MSGTTQADKLEASGNDAGGMPSGGSAGAAVAPCPLKQFWVEIELVDEDGTPVPNEPYWARLSDNREVTGTLDANGYARHEGIPTGSCLVRFPNRDKRDFQSFSFTERTPPPQTSSEAPASTDASSDESDTVDVWLEIELLNTDGTPVPSRAYKVTDATGALHEGFLNGLGFARVEGVLGASCTVAFPEVDESDFLSLQSLDTPALET